MFTLHKSVQITKILCLLLGLSVACHSHAQDNSDLSVTVGNVNPTTVSVNGFLTIPVTVSNLGNLASSSTTLRYLRSSDSNITLSDHELAASAVPSISPSGGSGTSWFGMIGPDTGTFWVGACVDADPNDNNPANDCSSGVEITVPDIDLVMLTVTASPTTFPSGQVLDLSTGVDNRGDDASATTTLRYKLSTNSSISSSDADIVTRAVPALAGQERWLDSSQGTINAASGTYWVGACIDAVSGETSTSNNCSAGVQVTVLSDNLPDLVVSQVIANPDSWNLGAFTDFFARVANQGSAASSATTVRFYLSTDNGIGDDDTLLGVDDVPGLNDGQTFDTGIFVDPQPSPGNYWFGACVQTDGVEFVTSNNCSVGVPVTVTENNNSCTNLPVSCGGTVSSSLSASDCDDSPRGTGYFAKRHSFDGGSGDEVIISADWSSDGYLYLVNPGGSVVAQNDDLGDDITASQISYTLNSAGSWTIWTTTSEAATAMSFELSLACTGAPEPDLTVDLPDVSPQTLKAAETLSMSATVRNQGGVSAPASTLRYLLSTDSVITSSDLELGADAIGDLAAGASTDQSIQVPGPVSPGSYWLGVCVDPVSGETNTGNNCSAGVAVTVEENTNACVDTVISCGQSLASQVSSSDCDDSPRGAGHFARSFSFVADEGDTVTVDVAWSGNGYLYLDDPSGSTVAENDDFDGATGSRLVRTLESAGDWKIWTTSADPGDALSFELDLACEFDLNPELTVATPAVVPVEVEYGENLSIGALVGNQGDAVASATMLNFIVSEDSEISAADTVMRIIRVPPLEPGDSRTLTTEFPALFTADTIWVGACADSVPGELDPTNNCSAAVEVAITRGEAIPFNAGLNDSWYNPLTDGQGFFINVFPDRGEIFLSWFTYEVQLPDDSVPANLGAAEHRWITAQGTFSGNQAILDIYVTEGGVFNTSPPDPESTKDGELMLEFNSCKSGLVSYDIASLNLVGEVPIQRLSNDNVPVCSAHLEAMKAEQGTEQNAVKPSQKVARKAAVEAEGDFQINEGLNDAWFDPLTAGQGFFINVFPLTQRIFLAWFTYDTERPDESIEAQLGEPGHRWLTALGSYSANIAALDIYVAEGGVFDDSPPQPVQHSDGEISLEFSGCNTGVVKFDIPSINQQGEVPIQRITLDNVPFCETFGNQAEVE